MPEQKPMNPIQFIKDVVSKMGSPGIRFLQLLPQFIELSPEYQDEFSDVYDSVEGQSKVAALTLLEREWDDLWKTLPRIGSRIGGGSIVTVYEAETVTGEKEVIKVRNPNIKYHLDETFRFAEIVIRDLAEKFGGGYSAAGVALDDIKEWIEGDISFEGFLDSDKRFRDKHNGYKVESGRYAIYIPESRGPENEYFVREELVEGETLTQWGSLVEQGHDMKQVVNLLVQNYIQQIADGQVHSDVHIGNFMVTSDDQVAIIDRNYYLDLSDKERDLVFSLVSPLASSDSKVKQLSDYLGEAEEISPEALENINSLVVSAAAQEWSKVSESIVKVKQSGVKIPLKITLLLKNFSSLQTMARKAGFTSLADAFTYEI